jgi:hypothetical protein
METKTALVIFLFLSLSMQAQDCQCDLHRSSHSISYQGNEALLKELIQPLRKSKPYLVGTPEDICEQTIIEIGTIVQSQIAIVLVETAFGISCKWNAKTLIFKNKKFWGYYYSSELFPKRIEENTLVWQGEYTAEYFMIISDNPPITFEPAPGLKMEFIFSN